MTAATEKTAPALMLDLVMGALRVDDPQLNAIATELLGKFGDQPLRRLVLAATDLSNTPRHRIRLLQAIRQIGLGSDPRNYFDLSTLVRDRNAAVRAAAKELVGFSALQPPAGPMETIPLPAVPFTVENQP